MKKRSAIVLLIGLFILTVNVVPQGVGLPTEIQSESNLTWIVDVAPQDITIMYYTEGGNMLATNGSTMSCNVVSVAEDVAGYFYIGNISVLANDTEIARDLVLGVWGTHTEWWPGFFIETGQSNIDSLNATAYASAERLAGNYLNGTMTSRYDNVSVRVWNSTSEDYEFVDEECIVFDYEQDPTGFGEPQITHLAYSLISGVLVEANTSYSFGDPYNLEISLVELAPVLPVDIPAWPGILIGPALIGGAILAVGIIAYTRLSRRN